MGKKVTFSDYDSLAKFIYENTIREKGSGSEGTVYQGKDGFAYKLMYEEPWASDVLDVPADEVIMMDEIEVDIESFAFPIDIYIIDDKLMGYKMKCVKKEDLVSTLHTTSYTDFYDIDIYDFHNAYQRLLEDVKKLSEQKIQLFDVTNNVMFDGSDITVVDTHYYTKENHNTYESNLRIIEKAVEQIFNFWLDNSDLPEKEVMDHAMLEFLEQVFDAMSELNQDEEFFFEEVIKPRR